MKSTDWFYSQSFHLPKPDYRCAVCGDPVERTQLLCRGDSMELECKAIDEAVDREIARRKALGISR